MKAVFVRSPEELVVGETSAPIPLEGEALVHVRAAGVNRADLLQAAGKYPAPKGASDILGLEIAGEVDGTGERVMALLPGGGYAERVAVPHGMLMPMPPGFSFVEAAAIPEVFLTAYVNLFLEGRLSPGERVLLHAAASGVGTAAIQLAKRAGAAVVGLTRSPRKCDPIRLLGADLALFVEDGAFAERIEGAFGKDAIDVVLDPVGAATLKQNLRVMAQRGRLVLIATMAGGVSELDLRIVVGKRLKIAGSTLRSRPLAEKVAITEGFEHEYLPGFYEGALRPVIDAVFPLENATDAHRRMRSNENVGKIVLTVP
jgi:putative PIG3 family NAD(P)H quinone oxidoreductase